MAISVESLPSLNKVLVVETGNLLLSQSDDEIVKKKGRGRGTTYSRRVHSHRNSPTLVRPGSNTNSPLRRKAKHDLGDTTDSEILTDGQTTQEEEDPNRFEDAPSAKGDGWKKVQTVSESNTRADTTECEDVSFVAEKPTLYDIIVTRVIDPHNFWAQFGKEGNLKDFSKMEYSIDEYCKNMKDAPDLEITSLNMQQMVLAHSTIADRWYRATVIRIDIEVEEVDVCFIDNGNNEVVGLDSIRQIPDCYKMQPQMAYMGRLNGVQPLTHSWIRRAIERFKELVLNKPAKAAVWMHNQILYIEIFLSTGELVAQVLLDDEVAMHADDPLSVPILSSADKSDDDIVEGIGSSTKNPPCATSSPNTPLKPDYKTDDADKRKDGHLIVRAKAGPPKFNLKNLPSMPKEVEKPILLSPEQEWEIPLEARIAFGDLLENGPMKSPEINQEGKPLSDIIEEQIQLARINNFSACSRPVNSMRTFPRDCSPKMSLMSKVAQLESTEKQLGRESEKEMLAHMVKSTCLHLAGIDNPSSMQQKIEIIESGILGGIILDDILHASNIRSMICMIFTKTLKNYDGHANNMIYLLRILSGHSKFAESLLLELSSFASANIKVSSRVIQQDRCSNCVCILGKLFNSSDSWNSNTRDCISSFIISLMEKWAIFKRGQTKVCEITSRYLSCLVQMADIIHSKLRRNHPTATTNITTLVKEHIVDGFVSRDLRLMLIDMLLLIVGGNNSESEKPEVEDKEIQCNDAAFDIEDMVLGSQLADKGDDVNFQVVKDVLNSLNLYSLYPKFVKWGIDDVIIRSTEIDLERLLGNVGISFVQISKIIQLILKTQIRQATPVHMAASELQNNSLFTSGHVDEDKKILGKLSEPNPTTIRGIEEVLSPNSIPENGVVTRTVNHCSRDSTTVDDFPPLTSVSHETSDSDVTKSYMYSSALKNRKTLDTSKSNSATNWVAVKSPECSMLQNQFVCEYEDADLTFVSSDSANKLYSEIMRTPCPRNERLNLSNASVRKSHSNETVGINVITNLVSDENQNRIYDQNQVVAPINNQSASASTRHTLTLHDVGRALVSNQNQQPHDTSTLHDVGRALVSNQNEQPHDQSKRNDWWSEPEKDTPRSQNPKDRSAYKNRGGKQLKTDVTQAGESNRFHISVSAENKSGEGKKLSSEKCKVGGSDDKSKSNDWWEVYERAASPRPKKIDKKCAKSLVSSWLSTGNSSTADLVSSQLPSSGESVPLKSESTEITSVVNLIPAGADDDDDIPDNWEDAVDDLGEEDKINLCYINGNANLPETREPDNDGLEHVDEGTCNVTTIEESFLDSDSDDIQLIIHDTTSAVDKAHRHKKKKSPSKGTELRLDVQTVKHSKSKIGLIIDSPKIFSGFDNSRCGICGSEIHAAADCTNRHDLFF